MQNAYLLSSTTGQQYYKDELGDIERAIFGCLCGNKEPLSRIAGTWHDRLWTDLKSLFTSKVLRKFIAERPAYSVLFTGASSLLVPLSSESSLSSLSLLRPDETTVFTQIQQVLLNTLVESLEGVGEQSDTWAECVHYLAELVRDNKDNIVMIVVVHVLIAMLYDGKITENSYEDYCYVLARYIQELSSFKPEMQIFYAGFLLNREMVVDVLSNQLLGIAEESKKGEVGTYLKGYFSKERDEIIEAIWNKSFAQKDDELLLSSVQWYLLDADVMLSGYF
eukprot:TRINITY_DN2598_c0_g3_i1.p1 TRINITY_DN2598_c0_g3~~TRINITY_DN2598_c0_g3_i1.p1  ORF type:complete len:279 (-),score=77.37 TRINITY_DN2598_c0_g3_i1:497-1333(-)